MYIKRCNFCFRREPEVVISRSNKTSRKIMDHSELVKELSHIEKLTNQERLKLAHTRRKLQLKNYEKYEKFIGSGGMGGSHKGKGNKAQQQQQLKLIEQQQQQIEEVRRARLKNKPRIRFRSSIMLLEAAGRNDISEGNSRTHFNLIDLKYEILVWILNEKKMINGKLRV